MAVPCQGLTGDLVIFSSMFRGGGERQHFAVWKALYEEIKGERKTDSRRGRVTVNERPGWRQLFL